MTKLMIIVGSSNNIASSIYQEFKNDYFFLLLSRNKPNFYSNDMKNTSFQVTEYDPKDIKNINFDFNNFTEVNVVYVASPFAQGLVINIDNSKLTNLFQNGIEFPLLFAKQIIKENKVIKKNFIFVSSSIAIYGQLGSSLYSLVKKAIESISESLAIEYANLNLKSNVLRIGFTGKGYSEQLNLRVSESIIKQTLSGEPTSMKSIVSGIKFLLECDSCNNSVVTIDGGLKPLL